MLPPDRVKPFLLHDDPDVRRHAAEYFSESWSDDPDILPMVLDACERYGFAEERDLLYRAEKLVVTATALDRLLDLLGREEIGRVVDRLRQIIVGAPAELLRDRRGAIEGHPKIRPEEARRIVRRIEYLDWTGERLWAELQDFSRRSEDALFVGEIDHDYADDLVDALGRHDVPDPATLCLMLVDLEKDMGWLETFLVDLAGRRRLRESVPILEKKLHLDDDFLPPLCSDALARIDDVEAVRLIRGAFPRAEFGYKLFAGGVLGRIKRPESEEAILALLDIEDDETSRIWLALSLCDLLSERSIEAVRREIATESLEALRELSGPALAVATILGIDPPPEAEEWRRERDRQREAVRLAAAGDWGDFEADDRDEPLDFGEPIPPAAPTIRNVGPRVGRNDPCPCGSGKKFKKCCGRTP